MSKIEKFTKKRTLAALALLIGAAACSSGSEIVETETGLPGDNSADAEQGGADPLSDGNMPRLRTVNFDQGNDGIIDERYQLLFDEAGLSIGELIDSNADGVFDHEFSYRYENNRLIEPSYDHMRDGSIEVIRHFIYDHSGVLQTLIIDSVDDGVPDRREDYAVDELGNIVSSELDSDGDGQINKLTTYLYDEHNRVIRTETVELQAGSNNSVTEFTYDAIGRLASAKVEKGDSALANDVLGYVYETNVCSIASNHQPMNHTCVIQP